MTFPLGDFEAHLQGALTYEGSRPSELVPAENEPRTATSHRARSST